MLRDSRGFLAPASQADSYYRVSVNSYDQSVELKLNDCYRSINWSFGKPGDKAAIRKIKKIKAVIDSIHDHLTEVDAE